jgi:ABC-type multidrug transport system ATPase subunit
VKRYGQQIALAGVDIDVRHGEAVAIGGPPGSGKTSLRHVLAGSIRADAGSGSAESESISFPRRNAANCVVANSGSSSSRACSWPS